MMSQQCVLVQYNGGSECNKVIAHEDVLKDNCGTIRKHGSYFHSFLDMCQHGKKQGYYTGFKALMIVASNPKGMVHPKISESGPG